MAKISILGKNVNKLRLLLRIGKWHFKYYFRSEYSPLACGIYVTNNCNFYCKFCNLWRNPAHNSIPFDKFKGIIDFLAGAGCFYLSLSGGEPFLVKDIFRMLSYAKSKVPYLHIVTNGSLLDEYRLKQLKATKIDEISISLDGFQKTHDNLRNKDGAFSGVISAIENIKSLAPEISIVVNTIICPENLDELPGLLRLVSSFGVKHKFQPVNLHPAFDGQASFSEKQSFSSRDMEKLAKFIALAKKQNNVVNSRYFLSLVPRYLNKETNSDFFKRQCLFSYHHCEINEKGEIFPCLTAMNWRNGFTTEKGIRNVFYSRKYQQKLSELKSCRLCRDNMYICYFEPRIMFPFANFLKYNILASGKS